MVILDCEGYLCHKYALYGLRFNRAPMKMLCGECMISEAMEGVHEGFIEPGEIYPDGTRGFMRGVMETLPLYI